VTYLNVMLSELLCERPSTIGHWVNGVVDCNLAILMIKPGVDILTTFLENLLTQDNRSSRSIDMKVIFWDILIRSHGGTAIIPKVKDARLDTKPF
jgi:hypothetical protein